MSQPNDITLHRAPQRRAAAVASIARDTRGAAVMEFGLCVAAFVALLLASAQVALIYFAQQNIQTSVEAVARKVMTGQVQSSTTSAAAFKQSACSTLPFFMSCAKLIVDARSASAFTSIDTSIPVITYDSKGNPTNTQFSTGSGGSIVILRLLYPWSVAAGPLGAKFSNQASGPRMLIGTMVFKSEQSQ